MLRFLPVLAMVCGLCCAEVLDRLAVIVGKDTITETEVLDEIRIAALLNGEKPDFAAAERRKAAERLVDQQLIRRDMQAIRYPEPEATEAERMLAEFRRTRFPDDAAYHAALNRYGLSEEQVKAHLLWQLAALRFTDYRFRPNLPPPGEVLREHLGEQSERRAEERVNQRTGPQKEGPGENGGAAPAGIDEQMEAWLKQARSRTRIRFREEVFR